MQLKGEYINSRTHTAELVILEFQVQCYDSYISVMPMLQKQILCPTQAEERGIGGGEDER